MDSVDIRGFASKHVDVQALPEDSLRRLRELAQAHQRRVDSELRQSSPVANRSEDYGLVAHEEEIARGAVAEEAEAQFHVIQRRFHAETERFDDHMRELQASTLMQRNKEKQIRSLRNKLYRESFREFWKATCQQQDGSLRGGNAERGSDGRSLPAAASPTTGLPPSHTALLQRAFRRETLPFAADPVDCWERGVVISPELQQRVRIEEGDGACAVSLPPYHELAMNLRKKYEDHKLREGFSIPSPAAQGLRTMIEYQSTPLSTFLHNYPYNVPPSHQTTP